MRLGLVNMDFDYDTYFGTEHSTGYERLLRDCMAGDATLFQPRRHGRSWMECHPAHTRRLACSPRAQLPELRRRFLGPRRSRRIARA